MNFVRKHIHYIILTLMLGWIFVGTFQPNLHMIGWDNFSASLSPVTNFGKVVFPTWRDNRGIGVESDSEVSDFSRRAFFIILASLLPKEALDQLYLFACLSVGVFAMYKLARLLLPINGGQSKNASLLASLFYLFNLNTLNTFFNPMVMYISRFALFPALILTFYKASRNLSGKNILCFVLVSFLFGSSFLTATVFITLLVLLLVIAITNPKTIGKSLLLITLTLCINAYWLGVFFDYTVNNAAKLTKNTVYIEVNEIQQNKTAKDYSWKNILTLKPDLQTLKSLRIIDGMGMPPHPTLDYYDQKAFFLLISTMFPLLFIVGIALTIIKKDYTLWWADTVVMMFILLARKAQPPLGFLYEWLTNRLPLFDVVFRFPDTKYYPLIAFAGSLLAGYAIYNILTAIKKPLLQKLLIGATIFLNIVAFYPYFTGQFVNPAMFVKIPQQYFEVVEKVNSANNLGRFIQLPNEKISYWKSYMWGYIGSDFLGYMLKKPVIDRTYEPASSENDQFNKALYELSKNPDNANLIANLLERAEVKYVLWDETVNPLVYSRGRKYWGTFNHDMYQETIKSLEDGDYLKPTSQGKIDITQYLGIYRNTENLHPDLVKYLSENKFLNTTLYEIEGNTPSNFQTLESAMYVSTEHSNLIEKPFLVSNTSLIQKNQTINRLLYPFYLKDLADVRTNKLYTELSSAFSKSWGDFTVIPSAHSQSEYAVLVKAKKTNQTLVFGFFVYSPFGKETLIKEWTVPTKMLDLNTQGVVSEYASDWWTLPFDQVSNSRLALDKTVIPLPPLAFYQPAYQNIATLLVENSTPTVSIFTKQTSEDLNLWDFELTDKPNCYKDMYPQENYLSELNKTEGGLALTTENGSSCITNPVTAATDGSQVIVDVKPNYAVSIENNKEKLNANTTLAYKYMNELPSYSYIDFCFINTVNGECLNNHKTLKLENRSNYIIPQTILNPNSKGAPQLVASVIPVGLQKINFILSSIQQTTYQRVYTNTLTLNSSVESYQIQSANNLRIPKILATDSYYSNSSYDAYLTYNQPCQEPGGYRTTKRLGGDLITYLNQCDHGIGLTLTYNPWGFYLWTVEYNLLSGKNPKFTLNDGKNEYKDEYVLLNDGDFPNIPGFKSVQNQAYNKNIRDIVNKAPYKTAYTYIYPNTAKGESKNQLFSITQNSRGEGLIKYKSMDIVRLPNSWAETRLEYGNPRATYGKLGIKQVEKYLPSFWRIEVIPSLWSPKSEPYLIGFNQAYDKNWKLYKNIWGVIFGSNELKADHVKINGLTNGWEINNDQLKKNGNTVIYVLYTPERLGVGGWIITISTLITLVVVALRKKQPPQVPVSQNSTEK